MNPLLWLALFLERDIYSAAPIAGLMLDLAGGESRFLDLPPAERCDLAIQAATAIEGENPLNRRCPRGL